MENENRFYLTAGELSDLMGISIGHAYKLKELKGPIYRRGQTGGNERWLGISENTTRNIRCRP